MSELRKLQNNLAWCEKFREYLLKDRPQPKKLNMEESMEKEDQRYSLGIDDDLNRCLPQAKIIDQPIDKFNDFKSNFVQNEADDTFSAMERMCDKTGSDPDSTLFQYLHSDDKEQIIHLAKERMEIINECADDTFSAMERMCDKSGSDPDSTLFKYLHSDDREQVIHMAKDRMELKEDNKEIESLNRLMAAIAADDQLDMESPVKGVEHTLLEDIEAPSRFWDNDSSVSQEASILMQSGVKRTSPVKMVGILRPSTIIETNEADASTGASTNVSSLISSFQTAAGTKTNVSSCYETATDTSFGGLAEGVSVDRIFYAAINKNKPQDLSTKEDDYTNELPKAGENCEVDNSVIELSSDGSDDDNDIRDLSTCSIKSENITTQYEDDENKENTSSVHFNNTMEEMEYMMQKGLEYIAAGAQSAPPPSPPKAIPSVPALFKAPAPALSKVSAPTPPKTVVRSPAQSPKKVAKQNTFVLSPRSKLQSPLLSQNKKVGPIPSCLDRFAINMEQPKRKFFNTTEQPASSIPMRQQMKLKPTYDHIVSPIRAYTHKSGTAPLMSHFHKTGKDFNSVVMAELEKESRHIDMMISKQHKDEAQHNAVGSSKIDGIDPFARCLPKKAYIASQIQHVVDERTPMLIPNVPKIQKYLNSAVEPVVLRNDGKMKLPSGESKVSHIPRPSNKSFADLSLASGDVSLYTMKDAQKF